MPPQKNSMSGPLPAAAAVWNAGIRPSVVCRTVVILTFGCSFSYAPMLDCSQLLAPFASCSPHHHIVRWTGPFGIVLPVGNSGLPDEELPPPDDPPHAGTATAHSPAATTLAAERPR